MKRKGPVAPLVFAAAFLCAFLLLPAACRRSGEDRNGASERAVTQGANPVFSPDGSHIAFQRLEGDVFKIGVIHAAGGECEWVEDGPGNAAYPAWTPDGGLVYMAGNDSGTAYEAWRGASQSGYGLRLWKDGAKRALTHGRCRDYTPCVSPDGKRVWFVTTRGVESESASFSKAAASRIAVLDLVPPEGPGIVPAAEPRIVLDSPNGNNSGYVQPVVSPDGSFLVWGHLSSFFDTWRICGVRLGEAGGDVRPPAARITPSSLAALSPRWHPNGRLICFTGFRAGDQGWGVWVEDIRTKKVRRLATGENPCFSPDGNSIAYDRDGTIFVRSFGPEDEPDERLPDIRDDAEPEKTLWSARGITSETTIDFADDSRFDFGDDKTFFVRAKMRLGRNATAVRLLLLAEYAEHAQGFQLYTERGGICFATRGIDGRFAGVWEQEASRGGAPSFLAAETKRHTVVAIRSPRRLLISLDGAAPSETYPGGILPLHALRRLTVGRGLLPGETIDSLEIGSGWPADIPQAPSLAAGLTAEQNGNQKKRYEITVDGTNCWSRPAGDAGASCTACEPLPYRPPAGARLEPVGDQHLVLTDASGAPLLYYHLVTDRWVAADKVEAKKRFGVVAWGVVAAYFLLMAGMAAHFMRKKKSAGDYFTGGGRIPWYVAGMSIFATMLSSISFLAVPAQYYISDWRYFPMSLGVFALAPFVIHFYLPFFRRLRVASAYEYLERRFNGGVRLFASGAYVVFMVSRVAIVTLLPALALNVMTGASIDACILVCGAATILYCAFGGFEAVVWSDFVQGIVLVAGALAILFALVHGTDGGLAGAWSLASSHGKTTLLDLRFVATEPVLWVVLVLALVENLSSYTSDQCVIQRYLSVKDERAAARSIWFNGGISLGVCAVLCAIGTALWTYYRSHPERLEPSLPKADSILPHFIVSGLPPVLAGLVVAALFAATVSTLSANLSSAATALTADFVLKFRPATPPESQMRWGRAFTFAVGFLGIAAALLLAHTETRSLFDKFKEFISVLTAGLAGLFFIGIFLRRVGGRAAIAGLVINYAACFTLRYATLPFTKPHVFLVGGIGFTLCVLSAWLLSFVIPERRRDLTGLTL